jgi:hypothetical protein
MNKVIIHNGWPATAIFIVHICLAIFELPNPLLHFTLIHNTWHTNATIWPMNFSCNKTVAFKNRITARLSKLAGFLIKLFNLNQCNATTCNNKWLQLQ